MKPMLKPSIPTVIIIFTFVSLSKSFPLSDILISPARNSKTEVTSSIVDNSDTQTNDENVENNKRISEKTNGVNSGILDDLTSQNSNAINNKKLRDKEAILDPDIQNDEPVRTTTFPTARIVVSIMKRSATYWEPWELNRDVCPPSLCTANSEKRPRGTANSVFYNGDIVLDKEYEKIIYGADEFLRLRLRLKRATTRSVSRLWKDGVVPYIFADTILPQAKKAINKAMKEIENKTCIRFRKKKLRDIDFLRFISEPGCWSSVGRLGGEQRLSIGRGCGRVGIAIHEISHALGLWHEQARPDRDKYIKVIEENISPRYLPDFTKANKSLVTSLGYPYDYESVMHYSKKAFTNLGEITIEVKGVGKRLNLTIGQREELSTIDIAQLRDMYKCTDKQDKNVTLCPKGWLKRKRSCYKFIKDKKEQFAGAAKYCEDLNSRLLVIENEKENKLIRKILKTKYPNITVWRTAGRKLNGTFSWYTSSNGKPLPMDYTNWAKNMPGIFSSMAIVRNRTANKLKWEGVWLGSYKQMPEHTYNFICERRAKRKCIPGQFKDGRDYRGDLDHTIDGITCQKWSSIYPHRHKLLPYPFDGNGKKKNPDGLGDHNYCRNPSGARKSRPWCYTTKKNYKWQYCDISVCSKKGGNAIKQPNNRINNKGEADAPYNDKKNRQANGGGKNNRGKPNRDKNGNKKNDRKNRNSKNNRRNHKNNRNSNTIEKNGRNGNNKSQNSNKQNNRKNNNIPVRNNRNSNRRSNKV